MSQDGPQRVELSPYAEVYTPPQPGLPVIVHGVAYPVPEDWESPTIDTPPQPPPARDQPGARA